MIRRSGAAEMDAAISRTPKELRLADEALPASLVEGITRMVSQALEPPPSQPTDGQGSGDAAYELAHYDAGPTAHGVADGTPHTGSAHADSPRPMPRLFLDAAVVLRGRGVFLQPETLPTRCVAVRIPAASTVVLSDVLVSVGSLADSDRDRDHSSCLVCCGRHSDAHQLWLERAGTGEGESVGGRSKVSIKMGTAVVLARGKDWSIKADDHEFLALIFSKFETAPKGDKLKGASQRAARKQEARRHKKALAASARAAACEPPRNLAIVPHGCFKSVPIPWEMVEEAHEARNPRITPAVEEDHVKKLYNAIAEHWHHTRWKAWPSVTAFIESLPPNSLVGDIGCGNGKNIPACDSVGMGVGCDLSSELIRICRDRGFEVAVADAMTLPYRDEVFDATLSIAVMHHLSSPLRRIRALAELTRVLKTGGRALIYAWAFEQRGAKSGHKFGSQDVFVPWHARETTVGQGARPTNGEPNGDDAVVTKTGDLDGEVLQRYCHVYKEGELEELIQSLPWLQVVSIAYDTGNWAVTVEKTAPVPPEYETRLSEEALQASVST